MKNFPTKVLIILTLLIFTNTFQCLSQNLTIYGNLYTKNQKVQKVYSAANGQRFNSKNFVIVTPEKKYTFTIAIAQIKESKIVNIKFALDTLVNPEKQGECYQTINILEIVNSPLFKNQQSINLESDLNPESFCRKISDEKINWKSEKFRFVGDYTLKYSDTTHQMMLSSGNNYYAEAYLNKLSSRYTNREIGNWNYDPIKKTLKISIHQSRNYSFGIFVTESKEYIFNVTETNGILSFSSPIGMTLEKYPDEIQMFSGE